jgi:hypothetical protein
MRARLTLWHTAVLAILLALFAAEAYAFVLHSSRARTDASLGEAVDDLVNELVAEGRNQTTSWYLAAAAYNAGPGTVATALRLVTGSRSGTDADFYRIAAHLPAETRDYVPKLIAAARIGKEPATYGLTG